MNDKYQLFLGNAINLFQQIEDETIDCIVTDPPYETISGGTPDNDCVSRPTGILAKNDGKIFEHNDIDIAVWIKECYRVLKPSTHIYIMTNFLNLEHYLSEIRKAGFDIHNLLIWEKNNATPNRWYMKNCEYIIFARKGAAKPIFNCGTKTVLQYKNVKDRLHPTEKPLDLLECLITNSTLPDEIILDPFGGSFSTALAAVKSGRRAISFEIDEKYFNMGKARLDNFDPSKIERVVPKVKPLTNNQKIILKILKEHPERDFTGAELSEITGLTSRTCSGCITPLCSVGLAEKTNSSSPFRIRLKNKMD